MNNKYMDQRQIFLLILFFTLFIISLSIVKILIVPLIFAIILVYLLNPVYEKIKKMFRNHFISSIVVMLLFFSIFVIPSVLLYFELTNELSKINTDKLEGNLENINSITSNLIGFDLGFNVKTKLVTEKIRFFFQSLIYKIPEFFFQIFLIIFFYYYFSRDYSREKIYFKSVFKKNFIDAEKSFKKLLNVIVYGQILVRFIQAFLGTIGFLIFGVNGAVFWGIMLFFMGFLPIVGTGIVWVPLALFYYAKQNFFIGTAIIGVGIFISTIDNLLLPYIVSEKTNMGPVITLVSMIGGLTVFGVYGIILGPLLIGLLLLVGETIFEDIRKKSPDTRKFIWSEVERKKYKNLKTTIAREEYIHMINKKYKKVEVPTA